MPASKPSEAPLAVSEKTESNAETSNGNSVKVKDDITVKEEASEDKPVDGKTSSSDVKEKDKSHSSSSRHKSSRSHSNSSSRRSSHSSSSKDKRSSRSSRSSSKEAHKSSSNHKSSASKHSSSHSSSSKSGSTSKHSDKAKDRHSSSSSRSKDESSKSRHDRSKSERSKDRHKSSSSSSKRSSKDTEKEAPPAPEIDESLFLDESDFEEDDLEVQCRMIFEGYTPGPTGQPAPVAAAVAAPPSITSTEESLAKYDDAAKRKRVAHENAERVERPTQHKATNHVQSALQVGYKISNSFHTIIYSHSLIVSPLFSHPQSVFKRQEIVRKQNELKQQKEAESVAKRQKLQEAVAPAPTVVQPSPDTSLMPKISSIKPPLTPIISPAALITPRTSYRPIAAVSNLLAIQKAKEKIEEMKAAKLRQQQQTIAHTVAKGAARVAHASKVPEPAVSIKKYLPGHHVKKYYNNSNFSIVPFDCRTRDRHHLFLKQQQPRFH